MAGDRAPRVKAFAVKPGNPSSIPATHMVERTMELLTLNLIQRFCSIYNENSSNLEMFENTMLGLVAQQGGRSKPLGV